MWCMGVRMVCGCDVHDWHSLTFSIGVMLQTWEAGGEGDTLDDVFELCVYRGMSATNNSAHS